MEQRCRLGMIWLTWALLPLLAVLVGIRIRASTGSIVLALSVAVVALALGVLVQVAYVRWFPRVSRSLGYGSVADVRAEPPPAAGTLSDVTVYTASACPFCPIVKRRLADLQRECGFKVREIDVTFRPEIVRAKGIRSVPVLEANGRFLIGNATSAQIAEFLGTAATVQHVSR